ncbi:MAG: hypothetical protein FH749_10505 [Firmicutes bacterium]|nr:hypothetical protein [Bacillota bacterium]
MYLNVENYADFYEVVNIPINRGNQQQAEHVFDGDLYIATSNTTFSSGKLMAAVLKFNDLGQTIGDPTGNATSAFGHCEWLELPNSGLTYGVSIRKWIMPNTEDNYQEAVMPDIPVPLTRDDIINNQDPVLNWIFDNH